MVPSLTWAPAAAPARRSSTARTTATSAEHVVRDVGVPASRVVRLAPAEVAIGVLRADAAGTLDGDDLAIQDLVDAADRDAVVGRDQAIAGIDQRRFGRRLLAQRCRDRRGAGLGLRVRAEAGFGHGA